MPLNMEFLPENQLIFPYQQNKHLIGNLKMTNKNDFAIVYKVFIFFRQFKASAVNKFVIRPSSDILKPGQSVDVQIVLHKDV